MKYQLPLSPHPPYVNYSPLQRRDHYIHDTHCQNPCAKTLLQSPPSPGSRRSRNPRDEQSYPGEPTARSYVILPSPSPSPSISLLNKHLTPACLPGIVERKFSNKRAQTFPVRPASHLRPLQPQSLPAPHPP